MGIEPIAATVLDAFLEFQPEVLPTKINVADRVIAARRREQEKLGFGEHMALTDALRALQVLLPSSDGQPQSSD